MFISHEHLGFNYIELYNLLHQYQQSQMFEQSQIFDQYKILDQSQIFKQVELLTSMISVDDVGDEEEESGAHVDYMVNFFGTCE